MVNVSSENNLISVDVSTSGNKANINVSGSNNNTNVSATPDLSMFWEQKSREWAISDKIVDNEDYSSKYYANISKHNAEIATEKADIATNQANIAIEKTEEVINSGNTALENISVSSENTLNLINTTGQEYLNNTKEYAEKALNSANNASVSETNALEHKNSALNSAQTATEKADIATVQANIAIEKANEALISSQNAKTSETNAKSSETRCEEILSRLGTSIKIKGRVESFSDLPLSGNLDGDTYLVGEDGLDSYPEYYWYQDHWEFLGTSNGGGSWGTITGDIYAQKDLQDLLSKKQNTLINQENIKSVNNQSLLGNGNLDIDTLENVTYAELVELKTNGQLKKGLYYRITDYVTTTNGATTNSSEPSRSAGHQFDIVIQAISENQLSEICTACLHEGDTYFASENLSGWQIWYDINNDTSKYAWADDTNGKGVIYRLIDEKGNDCSYDFKNIQFYRNPSSYTDIKTSLTATDSYYYTFSKYTSSTEIKDFSLGIGYNSNNVIGVTIDLKNGQATTVDGTQKLSNNVILLSSSVIYLTRNQFRTHCYNNTMVNGPFYDNIFVSCFTSNITKGDFHYNTFAGISIGNKIIAKCFQNSIDIGFNQNTVTAQMDSNIIGEFCYNNKIKGTFYYNTIDNVFQNNTLNGSFNGCKVGSLFKNNTTTTFSLNILGVNCTYNTFGDNFIRSSIGSNVLYNTFGAYNALLNIGSNIGYLKTASGTSTSAYGLRCGVINSGLVGASATNLLDLTALPKNAGYTITIGKDVNGKILATWSDLGVTKGKYKDSITATQWNDINTTIQIENWEE